MLEYSIDIDVDIVINTKVLHSGSKAQGKGFQTLGLGRILMFMVSWAPVGWGLTRCSSIQAVAVPT